MLWAHDVYVAVAAKPRRPVARANLADAQQVATGTYPTLYKVGVLGAASPSGVACASLGCAPVAHKGISAEPYDWVSLHLVRGAVVGSCSHLFVRG